MPCPAWAWRPASARGAVGAAARLLADRAARHDLRAGPDSTVLVLLTEGVTDPAGPRG